MAPNTRSSKENTTIKPKAGNSRKSSADGINKKVPRRPTSNISRKARFTELFTGANVSPYIVGEVVANAPPKVYPPLPIRNHKNEAAMYNERRMEAYKKYWLFGEDGSCSWRPSEAGEVIIDKKIRSELSSELDLQYENARRLLENSRQLAEAANNSANTGEERHIINLENVTDFAARRHITSLIRQVLADEKDSRLIQEFERDGLKALRRCEHSKDSGRVYGRLLRWIRFWMGVNAGMQNVMDEQQRLYDGAGF